MEKGERRKENRGVVRNAKKLGFAFSVTLLASLSLLPASSLVQAQNQQYEDITNSNFKIVTCDGPHNPKGDPAVPTYDASGKQSGTRPYVVCDFGAAMQEIQHLINIMIIVGVVAAIGGFCYAGYLYVVHGSESGARSEASGVFKKVFIGFIIMLTAWFVVYQILAWLQCGPGSTNCQSVGSALLGQP